MEHCMKNIRFHGVFWNFFQGCISIPGVSKGFSRDHFHSRDIPGFSRVQGIVGHPGRFKMAAVSTQRSMTVKFFHVPNEFEKNITALSFLNIYSCKWIKKKYFLNILVFTNCFINPKFTSSGGKGFSSPGTNSSSVTFA